MVEFVVSEAKPVDRIFIKRRFPFSSALKRMSTISSIPQESKLFVAVKGAPETLKSMYTSVPDWYDNVARLFAQRGQRVLALGWKSMNSVSKSELDRLLREEVESGLTFCGFLTFHCPLKDDSLKAVQMLNQSSHRVVMITGDHPLTACHVAEELEIVNQECLILTAQSGGCKLISAYFKMRVSLSFTLEVDR